MLFQATLTHDWVHAAQHISFLGSALLFWWSLLGSRKRIDNGAGILYLFTTGVHTSILGALLTFTPSVWYPAYLSTAPRWGLTALEDQQLGGLIMWVPAGIVYIIAGLALLGNLLRSGQPVVPASQFAE
jgi:cytochrome c oxidase assembly factor CtaG